MKASHKEKYIDAGLKKISILPLKTNARVNTRGSKMLPTNRAMSRTAGEEVLHSLEDERSRLIIGVGL